MEKKNEKKRKSEEEEEEERKVEKIRRRRRRLRSCWRRTTKLAQLSAEFRMIFRRRRTQNSPLGTLQRVDSMMDRKSTKQSIWKVREIKSKSKKQQQSLSRAILLTFQTSRLVNALLKRHKGTACSEADRRAKNEWRSTSKGRDSTSLTNAEHGPKWKGWPRSTLPLLVCPISITSDERRAGPIIWCGLIDQLRILCLLMLHTSIQRLEINKDADSTTMLCEQGSYLSDL